MRHRKFSIFFLILLYSVAVSFSSVSAAAPSPRPAHAPEVNAPSALIMDAGTGIVLYDKGMNDKRYPASITKIMTALLTLEYLEELPSDSRLSQRVAFSLEAVTLPYNSSSIAMQEGETLSIEQALYALMLASANEVANALAEHISGSVEAFAEKMNQKAKQLGAVNTHFSNPHGLHSEDHYTTAYDMALIMREAIRHPLFLQVVSTTIYEIPFTEKEPEPKVFGNTSRLIQPGEYFHENVIGGKTGFTNEAGQTLVTYGEKEGRRLICVVLLDEKPNQYVDTLALLDHGFTRFHQLKLLDGYESELSVYAGRTSEEKLTAAAVFSETRDAASFVPEETELGRVKVAVEKSVSLLLPDVVTKDTIETIIGLPSYLEAPVQKGDVAGKILLRYQGVVLGEAELIAQETAEAPQRPAETEKSGAGKTFQEAVAAAAKTVLRIGIFLVIGFFVLVLITRSVYQAKKRKRQKMRRERRRELAARSYRYRE